jgi:hypothetical protein
MTTIRLYRPSNGTEGECFFEGWCTRCARDKAMNEGKPIEDCDDDEKCDLIANSFAFDIDHPKYPQEWRYDDKGEPCCTAFVPLGEPIPQPRCPHTVDMFGDPA